MSKPLLVPIFSAAHVSKWDALPKDSIACTTQPRLEPERTDSWVNGDNDHDVYAPSESSEQGENVLSTRRECELSVRVAEFRGVVSTDRAGRVSRRFTKSRGTYCFFSWQNQPTPHFSSVNWSRFILLYALGVSSRHGQRKDLYLDHTLVPLDGPRRPLGCCILFYEVCLCAVCVTRSHQLTEHPDRARWLEEIFTGFGSHTDYTRMSTM